VGEHLLYGRRRMREIGLDRCIDLLCDLRIRPLQELLGPMVPEL
jgi:hypothetical protein